MAKPDTDDGWLKYAHELDAALACADWTKGARIVLKEVFAQIFGPAKRKVATISPSELSRRYGRDKANISRSVRELTESGVLDRVDSSTFRFVKDYEKWTKDGDPRFSKLELNAIRESPKIALAYATISGVSIVNTSTQNGCQSIQHPGVNIVNDSLSKLTPSGVNIVNTPYKGPRAELRRIENRESVSERDSDLGAEYTTVGLWAEQVGGDCSWAMFVSRMGHCGFAAGWIRSAIESASVLGRLRPEYVHGILKGYQRDGPPKAPSGPPGPKLAEPMSDEDSSALRRMNDEAMERTRKLIEAKKRDGHRNPA